MKALFISLCLLSMSLSTVAHADELLKADSAVANILFEYDGSEEYATYKVNEDGSVDLIFARNAPDSLYDEILTKLQDNPEINGVLASKGGPACKLF